MINRCTINSNRITNRITNKTMEVLAMALTTSGTLHKTSTVWASSDKAQEFKAKITIQEESKICTPTSSNHSNKTNTLSSIKLNIPNNTKINIRTQ